MPPGATTSNTTLTCACGPRGGPSLRWAGAFRSAGPWPGPRRRGRAGDRRGDPAEPRQGRLRRAPGTATATGPGRHPHGCRPAAVILDVGLPGHRRHRGLPPAARRRRLDAGPVRDRPRRRGRPDRRPGDGRRRLRHQAVLAARAGRPGDRRAAPHRRAPTSETVLSARASGSSRPQRAGVRRRTGRRADRDRVRPAGLPDAPARPGVQPRAAAQRGVGLLRRSPAPAPSTSTSRRCAPSSATPARSGPCAGVGYAVDAGGDGRTAARRGSRSSSVGGRRRSPRWSPACWRSS